MTTNLTDSQKQTIQIALAEFAGWTPIRQIPDCNRVTGWGHPDGHFYVTCHTALPNYPASLDACHEIEVKLTDDQFDEFHRQMWETTNIGKSPAPSRALISASAEQRALALYRALNLGELGD